MLLVEMVVMALPQLLILWAVMALVAAALHLQLEAMEVTEAIPVVAAAAVVLETQLTQALAELAEMATSVS